VENCDAVLKAFVSDWYNIRSGTEKNHNKGYLWALKAAMAPCRTPTAKFSVTVEALSAKEVGSGDIDEGIERDVLAECLSYVGQQGEAAQRQREEKFVEMISNSDVLSSETLRREFWHSGTFPHSSLPPPRSQPTSSQTRCSPVSNPSSF
jgi:hypothetical protein